MKNIHFLHTALSLTLGGILSSNLYGADLNATSIQPKITFIDSNHHDGVNTPVWEIKQTEGSGFDYFYLRNIPDNNKIISINRLQDGTSQQGGSLLVNSSGDLSLAGGAVFIDRSTQSLNIGTVWGDAALNIKGTSDIVLDNDTTAWRISNIGDWLTFGPSLKNRYVFNMSPLAPLYAFNIIDNGFIGIGNPSPQAKLDVQGNAIINGELNTTQSLNIAIEASNTLNIQRALTMSAKNTNVSKKSDVGFVLENRREAFAWQVRTLETDSSFAINKEDSGGKELIITGMDETGGMVLTLGNGASNTGGNWVNASSRELKENIEALSTEEALEAFHALKPVSYNYKTDKTEQVLGFIAEDVPDIVAINSRKGISSMDMVALLTKVLQEQAQQLESMKEEINQLKSMQTR